MGWKPSAPVSIEQMLADQKGRRANNNYGNGLGWMGDTTGTFDDVFDFDIEIDNPYFTSTNQPGNNMVTSRSWSHDPFLWHGDNKSLRKVYKQAYDQYYGGDPTIVTTKQNQTWNGPEIRALYDDSDVDALISGTGGIGGTPDYWQDNNFNNQFEFNTDSELPVMGMMEENTAAQQPQAMPEAQVNSGGSFWDRIRSRAQLGSTTDDTGLQGNALEQTMWRIGR